MPITMQRRITLCIVCRAFYPFTMPPEGNWHSHITDPPAQVSRYLTPSMLAVAAGAGLELCLVDPAEPLELQGPFDAIIHKLRPDAG